MFRSSSMATSSMLARRDEALRQSGAAAVMIGRGAQDRPWAVGQIGAALEGRAVAPAPAGSELAALVRRALRGHSL